MTKLLEHLSLAQMQIRAGGEHTACSEDWVFLRVCSGVGYFLSGGAARDLHAADLVVVPAKSKYCLRASQIGMLCVCRFNLQPRHLAGFFTLDEQRAMEDYACSPNARPLLVPSDDPLAQSFAGICRLRLTQESVVLRGEMLLLALRSLPKNLAQLDGPQNQPVRLVERLCEVMGSLTEAELMNCSTAELARRSGCGERHFRRLFRQRYGTSLMNFQIRLRINLAKRILQESDAKVTDVAFECGFQHLGLFNSIFKRNTGTTPSKWRAMMAVKQAHRGRDSAIDCPLKNGGAVSR